MRPGVDDLVQKVGENGSGGGAWRRDRPGRGGLVRRVFVGGLVGGLPGLLLAVVPMLLHDAGVLTADQSQIGFVGVPLLFLGVFVGTAVATSDGECDVSVMLGLAGGFVVGLGGGLLMSGLLLAAGVSVGGLWLLVAPAAMIAGAVLAARRCAHTHPAR